MATPEERKKADKQRRKIISLAHEMRWQRADNPVKADMDRINDWCVKFGYLHKPLNEYDLKELPRLVTQFKRVHKTFMDELNRPA